MKLYWSSRSPYVRKVMVVAHEAGLAEQIELERVVVSAYLPNTELLTTNPLGKIPTLVLDDGTAVYDSRVICEYLDGLHQGPRLFPQAGPERLQALRCCLDVGARPGSGLSIIGSGPAAGAVFGAWELSGESECAEEGEHEELDGLYDDALRELADSDDIVPLAVRRFLERRYPRSDFPVCCDLHYEQRLLVLSLLHFWCIGSIGEAEIRGTRIGNCADLGWITCNTCIIHALFGVRYISVAKCKDTCTTHPSPNFF